MKCTLLFGLQSAYQMGNAWVYVYKRYFSSYLLDDWDGEGGSTSVVETAFFLILSKCGYDLTNCFALVRSTAWVQV